MDADASDELREIAGLAALACGARVVALVPRSGAGSHVGGPGVHAAGLPPGTVHALQLAHATADLHVIARVPVTDSAHARLASLVVYAREPRAPLGAQPALLAGLARLAARALTRVEAAATERAASAGAGAAVSAAGEAAAEARVARLLARALVAEGRRVAARLRDDVVSATAGSSLLLAALAARLPALGARVVADAEVARVALDAATLTCRQLAESQPAFVASGYSFHGALALYVAHLTRSRWPACTIDVAPEAPREFAADATLLLLGLVAQGAALAQRRPGCRHLAIRVFPLAPERVRLLVAADGAAPPADARVRRRLAVATQLARHARAQLWTPVGHAHGDDFPPDARSALATLCEVTRVGALAPVLVVTVPHRRGRAA